MKNIVYFAPSDIVKFDFDRFEKSLNTHAAVPKEEIETALKDLDEYETLHVSRLVKAGVQLLDKFGSEEAARAYYDDHKKYFGEKFERLRRITGYLVGTLDRWNDGKKAEEKERVKHNVDGVYTTDEKARREVEKLYADRALGKE